MYEVWAIRHDGTKVKLDEWWTLESAQASLYDWKSRFSYKRIWIS